MASPSVLGAAIAGSLLLALPAAAAEQGGFGAQSKGEIAITLTVAERVTMSTVAASPQGAGGDAQRACLWLDTATRGYAVTALDAPVAWRQTAMARAGVPVAAGTTLANLSSSASHPDCSRDPSLFVAYDALGGAQTGPATLLIAPE